MQEYIRNTFGTEAVKENYVLPKNAPMYLKNEYAYCKYIINGQHCLFLKSVNFTLAGYRKHRDKLILVNNEQAEASSAHKFRYILIAVVGYVIAVYGICATDDFDA